MIPLTVSDGLAIATSTFSQKNSKSAGKFSASERVLDTQTQAFVSARSSESGYLYHPSPFPATAKWQRRLDKHLETQASSPFGNYSLLSSDLVLSHFAAELDVDENGGTVAWRDKQWHVLPLQAGDLKR